MEDNIPGLGKHASEHADGGLDEIIDPLDTRALRASINVETLSATKTLVVTDLIVHWLDPNGSDRDVVLPAEASSTDVMFIILNDADGAGEDLVVKNDGAATIATLGPGMTGMFSCDGTDWKWENDTGVFYDGVNGNIELTNKFKMSGDGLVSLQLSPSLDSTLAAKELKPTPVTRGVIPGLSLPIYNTDNEEIFFDIHVPRRWDGVSNITVHCHVYLDTANDTKNFNIQCSWEHYSSLAVVPATTNDLTVETATGSSAAQYQGYLLVFTIDYDIDGEGNEIQAGENLCMRLRRIAASANEAAGEIVVTHLGLVFNRDKIGVSI